MPDLCLVCGLPLEVGQFGCITTIRPHGIARIKMIEDSIPGGLTIENLSAKPQTFYSKSEYREACKVAGVVNKVQHVPKQGSDKSEFTSRWV
jgi:hypothetical protein